jgi:RNA polymerase sigma-70 factor (ECF subfamily)
MFSSKKKSPEEGQGRELAARCIAGEIGAFEELYREQGQRIYNLACRMAGNAADAEELVQDVFLLAHRKLDTFKGESALGTWLYRLAVNLCVDHLRSRQARMGQATDPLENGEGQLRPIASGPPPEPGAVARLDLERAIALLPESYRAAFVLHDVEGLEHREIGRVLGIAEGTSKSLLHKARMRLRAILAGA